MNADILTAYGKGAAMLLRMGYVPGTGLGERQQGIIEPIMPSIRKRGEGIKVDTKAGNMMQSRIVDDWSDSSEDEEEATMIDGKEIKVSLGFEKSGTYKSDYYIPELYELVNELKANGMEIPVEFLEFVDSIGKLEDLESTGYLEMRRNLWEILKKWKVEYPKIRYLEFEINNIEEESVRYERNLKIMNKCKEIIENGCGITEILEIKGINELDKELKIDILKFLISKIKNDWNIKVDNCDFYNFSNVVELMDYASEYLSFNKKLDVDYTIVDRNNFKKKEEHDNISIRFSIMDSMIFQPLIEKVNFFFKNEWNFESVNIGINIYEELNEIFEKSVFEEIIIKRIIMVKFKEEILSDNEIDFEKDQPFKWIVEWFSVLPIEYVYKLAKLVINRYCRFLKDYKGDINNELLEKIGINYWSSINVNDEIYKEKINRAILEYCIKEFRSGYKFKEIIDKEEYPDILLDYEMVEKVELFMKKIFHFKLEKYENVINNEILIPYQWGFLKNFEINGDYETYLIEWTRLFARLGILDGKDGNFKFIIDTIYRNYLHVYDNIPLVNQESEVIAIKYAENFWEVK